VRRTEKPAGALIAIKVLQAVNSPFEKAAEPEASRGPLSSHSRGNPCHRWYGEGVRPIE